MIRTTRLDNGVTVLTDTVPARRSVAIALCWLNGVRHEGADEVGFAHLAEHLLFPDVDSFAVDGNAVSGREVTAFSATTTAEGALPLIAQVANAFVRRHTGGDAIARELRALSNEDQQICGEDDIEDLIAHRIWPDHPMGRSLRSAELISKRITTNAMQRYLQRTLTAQRIFVFAVGAIDHEATLHAATPLSELPRGEVLPGTAPRHHAGSETIAAPQDHGTLILALPAPPQGISGLEEFELLLQILATDPHGRLNQRLRDGEGLTYGVTGRMTRYSDCGVLILQLRCAPDQLEYCEAHLDQEVHHFIHAEVNVAEIAKAKQAVITRLRIAEDQLTTRLERYAAELIYTGQVRPLEANIARIDRVSAINLSRTLDAMWRDRYVLKIIPRKEGAPS